jgi:hypothetical protein
MALYNPSTFTTYVNDGAMRPGNQIITTQPSNVASDQLFVLDAPALVVTHNFVVFSSVAAAYETIATYLCDAKDMCGDPTTGLANYDQANNEIVADFYAYCAVSNGTTRGTIRLSSTASASSNGDVSVDGGAGGTTWAWRGPAQMRIKTNNNEETLTLKIQRDAGAGDVYIAGIALQASIT